MRVSKNKANSSITPRTQTHRSTLNKATQHLTLIPLHRHPSSQLGGLHRSPLSLCVSVGDRVEGTCSKINLNGEPPQETYLRTSV